MEGLGSAGDSPPAAFALQGHCSCCPTPSWESVGHPEWPRRRESHPSPVIQLPPWSWQLRLTNTRRHAAPRHPKGPRQGPGCLWVARQDSRVPCRDVPGTLGRTQLPARSSDSRDQTGGFGSGNGQPKPCCVVPAWPPPQHSAPTRPLLGARICYQPRPRQGRRVPEDQLGASGSEQALPGVPFNVAAQRAEGAQHPGPSMVPMMPRRGTLPQGRPVGSLPAREN